MDSTAGPDRSWRGRLQQPEESTELAGANDQSLEYFWKTAIRRYTVCDLTKGRDKLIAMWGIAKLVRDAAGVEYGAGLWEQNLENQLAWRVLDCTLEVRPSESTAEAIQRPIPSWSWASMDGRIEVADRMTGTPHYAVKDHYNRPLAFDLKGVKRTPAPPKISEQPPPLQPRGMSDSGVELQRRSKELQEEQNIVLDLAGHPRSHSPEKIDRDAEPAFHSTSLPIQGHVGRGRLEWSEAKKKWAFEIEGLDNEDLEVFPDTIPKISDPVDAQPFFVVLSAERNTQSFDLSVATTADGVDNATDFQVSGVGLLMKNAGQHHFRRTGALFFRNIDVKDFARLQQTYEYKDLPPDKYDFQLGRKFWLD